MNNFRFRFIIIIRINGFQIWKIYCSIIVVGRSKTISEIGDGVIHVTACYQTFTCVINVHYAKTVLQVATLVKGMAKQGIITAFGHTLSFGENNECWLILLCGGFQAYSCPGIIVVGQRETTGIYICVVAD